MIQPQGTRVRIWAHIDGASSATCDAYEVEADGTVTQVQTGAAMTQVGSSGLFFLDVTMTSNADLVGEATDGSTKVHFLGFENLSIAYAVWDEPMDEHLTDGTTGKRLSQISSLVPGDNWVAITPDTLDESGTPLGKTLNGSTGQPLSEVDVIGYLQTDTERLTVINQTESDIDGDYTLWLPPSGEYDIVFRFPSFGEVVRQVST